MSAVCPNCPCPDCPVCDRILTALQVHPGEAVSLVEIASRAGHWPVLKHLLHLWKAEQISAHYDGTWSTDAWPEHEETCETLWEVSGGC